MSRTLRHRDLPGEVLREDAFPPPIKFCRAGTACVSWR